jgi:hypothetical protein
MAKARQVGTPHLPQFVLGKSLKICIPVSAIDISLKGEKPNSNNQDSSIYF